MSGFHPVRRAAAAVALGGGIAAIALSAGVGPALAKSTHGRPHATASTQPTGFFGSGYAAVPTVDQSVVANITAGPLSAQFTAKRAAGAPETSATGTFHAVLTTLGDTVMELNGPVTCLAINGPDIGLFYPVTSSTPAAEAQLLKGVYINVEMGANGKPLSLSFRPSTSATDSHCDPLPGLIPITSGTVTFGS